MKDKFNIAVVGCGAMARGTHIPNILRHPGINLRWCCDSDDGALRQAAEDFTPERTTGDVNEVAADSGCDAALLATHPAGRIDLVRILASAGKHIYAEKPVADNMPDMIEIQKIVKHSGVTFTVGHNRRLAPAVVEAKKMFQKHRRNPVSEPWRWNRARGARPALSQEEETMILLRINDDYFSWKEWCFGKEAGILLLELNHFTDIAHYFVGSEPVSVSAAGSPMMNVVLNIRFECGALCTIFDACVGSFAYPKELYEIYHKGAVIAVDHCMEVRSSGIPGEPFRKLYPSASDPTSSGIESFYSRTLEAMRGPGDSSSHLKIPSPDKGHYWLLDAFMKACRGEGENPCCAGSGSRAAAVVLKAAQSIAKGGVPQQLDRSDYLPQADC